MVKGYPLVIHKVIPRSTPNWGGTQAAHTAATVLQDCLMKG